MQNNYDNMSANHEQLAGDFDIKTDDLSTRIYIPKPATESETFVLTYPHKATYTLSKDDLGTDEGKRFVQEMTNNFSKNISRAQQRYETCDRIQRITNMCTLVFGLTTAGNYLLGTSTESALAFGVAFTAFTATISAIEAYDKKRCKTAQSENKSNLLKLDHFIAQNK